jgi:hypothetical protein
LLHLVYRQLQNVVNTQTGGHRQIPQQLEHAGSFIEVRREPSGRREELQHINTLAEAIAPRFFYNDRQHPV